MEKETLLSTAVEYFAQYPKEEVLLITPDGMVFLNDHALDAKNHANSKFNGELFQFTRAEVEAAASTENAGEEIPTAKSTKPVIQAWLEKEGRPTTGDATKEELLKIVAEVIESKNAE